jgi:hypothetical protein
MIVVAVWFQVLVLILLIALVTIGAFTLSAVDRKSSFVGNDPNSIRHYQLVDGQSQNSRQAHAVNKPVTSGMTGSRDIPVFFQDYEYEMTLGKTGLSNSREGMVGDKPTEKNFKLN